ncbi:aggregation-promoting factor C-terminal-like domain-containing protein [Nonomuraea gerenzanensis]|uniref:Secreted protein n=1 Tax=Nonomuraea gerenzanensis TaxID=93944 RepID=A0A1M4EJ84_9ACTN|nr:lytic transglycosylase domain-containing protein [Nonomuraea gerenzanensis]UBU10545.1 lytic transglycosylase domain-containing protein [Nonomuraea gerenzanensis]SBO98955.1 Secreted protein precursor [Nonomuraea gerenzanensis]
MDSKRVLSGTLVSITAFTALSAALSTTASARAASPDSKQPIRTGIWTTSAQPKMAAVRPASRNKKIALDHVVQRAWNFQEFRCLDNLWTRESNWNHRALNHSSGAYGIPQALPAGKMSGAGRDWKSNPETQIRWGLAYIKGRYGRPCGAWGHWKSHNWY